MKKLKLGILGSGFLGGIIANAWKNGLLKEYELVGIAGRNEEKTNALAAKVGCNACRTSDELLALKPDYIAEAASGAAVREIAIKALSSGTSLIVLSIGAFADTAFYEEVKKTAAEHKTRVHIASGAVGGFDVLRTVSLMGKGASEIHTHKGPASLQNTPLFKDHLLTDTKETCVFDGNAKDAIALLPTKVNVAVATSLATTGPENTSVRITSVPGFVGDDHCITAEIEGVKAVVDIYSSTSAIAGWSVVSVLQNIVSPIVF
ncbi:L-aspartate dehydrogenase [gut metagenome]|uniref:L-aspartate dehydrogenase n=1 Tax=gut metagenome TaxID=749906 RepID=J9GMG3_9ZZZZ